MQHERASPPPAMTSLVALMAAFAVCSAVIAFSWPDPRDRKRAVDPDFAECCEAPVPRRAPASTAFAQEFVGPAARQAVIVPASVR